LSFSTTADNAGQLTIDPNPFYGVGSCYVNAIEVQSVLPVGVPLVTSFSWDANGSLVGMQAPGGGLTTYSWDAANRLSSAVLPNGSMYNEVYRYDDLRQTQVGPLGPEVYLYDAPTLDPSAHFGNWTGVGGAGTAASAETGVGDSGIPNVLYWSLQSWGQHFPAQMLLHGPNLVRAVGFDHTEQARQRQYHLDAQGSVQATTQAGGVEALYGTDAWGTVLTGNPGDPDWYTTIDNYQTYQGGSGYWQEVGLGLEYVRARWLDPNTGSWLSVDPVSGEPRYSYDHNSPTLRTDPSGRYDFLGDVRRGYAELQQDWQMAVTAGQAAVSAGITVADFEVHAFEAWATPDHLLGMIHRMQASPLYGLFKVMPGIDVALRSADIGLQVVKAAQAMQHNVEKLLPKALANLVPKDDAAKREWMWTFVLSATFGFFTEAFNEIPVINELQLIQTFVQEFKHFQKAGFTVDTVFQHYINDPIVQLLTALGQSSDVPAELVGGLVGAMLCMVLMTFLKELIAALLAPESGGASEVVVNADVAVAQGGRFVVLAQKVAQRLKSGRFSHAANAISDNPRILSAFNRITKVLGFDPLKALWKALPGRIGNLRKAWEELLNRYHVPHRKKHRGKFPIPTLADLDTIERTTSNQCVNIAYAIEDFMSRGCQGHVRFEEVDANGNTLKFLDDISKQAGHSGFREVKSFPTDITRELQAAGPGARGIIGIPSNKPNQLGHAINVVFDGANVRFIDGGGDRRFPPGILTVDEFIRRHSGFGQELLFARTDPMRHVP
jgi:RHS repeat-associated protein